MFKSRTLVLLAAAIAGACSKAPQRPEPPPQSTRSEGASWALQAVFPGATSRKVAPVATPAGVLEQHTEMFQDAQMALVVQWADYPPAHVAGGTQEAFYDQAARGAAQAVGGRIQDSRRVELAGIAGREVLVDDGRGAAFKARMFLLGSRFHLAGVTTAPARISDPRVSAFFASLRLVPRSP
jgi:hypothetical protein